MSNPDEFIPIQKKKDVRISTISGGRKKRDIMTYVVPARGNDDFRRIAKGVYVFACENALSFSYFIQSIASPCSSSILVEEDSVKISMFNIRGLAVDTSFHLCSISSFSQ